LSCCPINRRRDAADDKEKRPADHVCRVYSQHDECADRICGNYGENSGGIDIPGPLQIRHTLRGIAEFPFG
jgi:hypothetical protein